MSVERYATLADGRKLPYMETDSPPRGGMKYTYFAPDKSYVVQFFNEPEQGRDPNMQNRLQAIIGRYNPTISEENGGALGGDALTAKYFGRLFCWPQATVTSPEFGIVCPTYPKNFFFKKESSDCLSLKGKDKRSYWFTSPKTRSYLNPAELGDFRSMLSVSLKLARAVRRMHQAGLAHSDLSGNNVLIDPMSGDCVVIDIDSLVVPGLFAPEVAGTKGYIAPEVVDSMNLPTGDPRRVVPNIKTDLFALPVLIYQYLLCRHPLVGPKIHAADPDEDDFLSCGRGALFIENPLDTSNRPPDLKVTVDSLGLALSRLFMTAFVDGLHDPPLRPTALEWEKALSKTYDLLQPCSNCSAKWFVLDDAGRPVCPFCGKKIPSGTALRFLLHKTRQEKPGLWRRYDELNIYSGRELYSWHFSPQIFENEKAADREVKAKVVRENGTWYLLNQSLCALRSEGGNLVPPGGALWLREGAVFQAGDVVIEVKTVG